MPHSNAFISLPFPFARGAAPARKRSAPAQRAAPPAAQMRPRPNWHDLSRRAHAVLSDLRATPDPAAFEAALRRHVARDPANPFLWHALAKHLSRHPAGVDPAIAVLAHAARRVPPGLRGGLFEAWGSLELRRGNLHRAFTIYADALRTDPFAALYVSLAVAQMKLHMLHDARDTFRQGSRAFPAHAPLWRAWAFLETQHGAPTVARDRWRTAVAKDTANVRAWKMLVQTEQRCGATQPAIADLLAQALVSCPLDADLRLQLARIEERRKGPAAGRSILLTVEPHGDVNVLRALARLEFEIGDRQHARNYFKRAADAEAAGKDRKGKRRPKERTVRSLHSWALMESKFGHVHEARRILDQAKSISRTDSGVWRAIAEIESRERNFEEARLAFQQALALDPDDPRLYLAWGRTEALAGNTERAEALIDKVSELVPNGSQAASGPVGTASDENSNGSGPARTPSSTQSAPEDDRNVTLTPHLLASALRERAMLASRDGRFDDSVSLLTRASVVEPNFESGWRLLASQELRLKGIDSARLVYQKAMESVEQRSKPRLLHWWGQDERAYGSMDRARELFRLATCANPDYMSAWMSWGLMEKAEGSVDKACSIFEQATRRAEQDVIRAPYIFQAWGRVEELERGRPDKAADIFQRGVKLAPRSGPLWSAWGMLERRRGNIEKARELFNMATTAEPKHGTAWQSWATLEAQRGNFKKASELFQVGTENDPANSALLVSWAQMEGRDLGNVALGRDLYERAVKADPQFGLAWHSWGCLEMGAGNINRARDLLQKASELRGDDVASFHSLGVLEAEHCDNAKEAVRHWKHALDMWPGHSMIYQSWGLLEGRRGDLDMARKIFEEGIAHAEQRPADKAMLLQAWASLEERNGTIDKARDLLRRSLHEDEGRAESWNQLAGIEKSRGLREEARQLLREGIESAEGDVVWSLYASLGMLEAEDGNVGRMREVFGRGIRTFPAAPGLWKAFVAAESRLGSIAKAEEIRVRYEELFAKRDAFEADL